VSEKLDFFFLAYVDKLRISHYPPWALRGT